MKILQLILMYLFLSNSGNLIGQSLFYQDNCNCGVTGAGYSNGVEGAGITNANLVLNINPSSTIKKAFLLFNRFGDAEPLTINFNGAFYELDSTSQVGQSYISSTSPDQSSALHSIDVTNNISETQNIYSIQFEEEFLIIGPGFGAFGSFYLLVVYENELLPATAISIFLNDKHSLPNVNYNFNGLFPIDNSNDVGLAIHSDIIWDTIQDGSYVYVNGNYLGLIGGSDAINNMNTGAGVKGHFFYESNQLFGLDDDTPDNQMGGTDGLADIDAYLTMGATSMDLNLIKQVTAPYNLYLAFYLAYTTTCDTFSVSLLTDDTTICKGDSLQFTASGADSYEWTPSTGLSCDDCPNPKISSENSTTYFLTSTKYGNCKKTQPIKIKVVEPPKILNYTLQADTCGNTTGAVYNLNASGTAPLVFALNGNSTNAFTNLQAGVYNLSVSDGNGCSDDSLIFIPQIIAADAGFTANPYVGLVPLNVDFIDESRFATNWVWYINGDTLTTQNPTYNFDEIGSYTVTQIVYNTNFWCADTAYTTINVFNPITIFIPNIITANNDNINDDFVVKLEGGDYIQWHIMNRWGQEVYLAEKTISTDFAEYNLWDGVNTFTNLESSDGVYFYRIIVGSPVGTFEIYTGSLTVVGH